MVGVEVAIILVLLGINAVLAASEIAIVSARKTRLRALADDGNEAAAQVLALNENPSAFLATIQVGITLADEEGQSPQDCTTWQFNFKFSLGCVG